MQRITGLILAGGEGRRMGGRDKGLIEIAGGPMIERVVTALAPLVDRLIISANRSRSRYQLLCDQVVSDDERFRFSGPLAGLLAGLRAAQQQGGQSVLVCPCDTPKITAEVLGRLVEAYSADPSRAVVAASVDGLHPLHGIYPVALAPVLEQWLQSGERRVMGFARHVSALPVDCSDFAEALVNCNDPEQLGRL